ncbi:MAG: hypothetical protein WCD39_01900, partial [Methyloceanibacter sp.]
AHHCHRGKAAGNFEPAPPSRVCDCDLRQPRLRLSKRRRGSLEHQPEGAAAHPNESDREADAKNNFQDVKFLLATELILTIPRSNSLPLGYWQILRRSYGLVRFSSLCRT